MGGSVCTGELVTAPERGLAEFLVREGLASAGEEGQWTPLAGGVSSDIWRVQLKSGDYCVKRALAQLKVAAEWKAPIERNATEWAYFKSVSSIAPGAVPRPIAHDRTAGLFAMEWLPPDRFALWKTELLAGRVDTGFAAKVGSLLSFIHGATADDRQVATRFATDSAFHSLRIEPYLLTIADRHASVARRVRSIAAWTAATRRVLVHGDASPKNILIGPDGPVLLDAEVAWFGDPAFDLAFCLNHLVLKHRVLASQRNELALAFGDLAAAYLSGVHWEDPSKLEQRAAALLTALALARVDGKSPVEYLSDEQKDGLRIAAIRALDEHPETLADAQQVLVS